MDKEYIAHIRKIDKQTQLVKTHLLETSFIAKTLAEKLDLGLSGELLGLMHDFGKYIKSSEGIAPDAENDALPSGKKIDHSTAGAQWVYRAGLFDSFSV